MFKEFSTIMIMALIAAGAMASQSSAATTKKALVVYFSHTGNTREIANQIKKASGADIFEVKPVKTYPADYNTLVAQAKKEIGDNYRPVLKVKAPANLQSYDVIFVGSPCWWGTVAPPIATFLTQNNFAGKTIVPFMTHEGSGMGHSEDDIKKFCPKSKVLDGLPIRGGSVKSAQGKVTNWLKELGLAK
jgi:flavodoxin